MLSQFSLGSPKFIKSVYKSSELSSQRVVFLNIKDKHAIILF